MKIKIISGTYGWRPDKNGSVEPVSKGGTCEVPDTEAARLVGLGVASYVDASAQLPAGPPTPPAGGPEPPSQSTSTPGVNPAAQAGTGGETGSSGEEETARLEKMPKDDLIQMAQDLGVDISGAKNKHEIAVLIAASDGSDSEEAPPAPTTGDIVR